MSRLLPISLVLASVLTLGACGGDPKDRPQDCSASEFFDEVDEVCESCPALLVPSCREGCAILISNDDRGCPEASCDLSCESCPSGTSFSLDTLACEPICSGDASYDPVLETCTTCPELSAAVPDCSQESCECSLEVQVDVQGCVLPVCGSCSSPSEGFSVDEQGMCVMDSTSN